MAVLSIAVSVVSPPMWALPGQLFGKWPRGYTEMAWLVIAKRDPEYALSLVRGRGLGVGIVCLRLGDELLLRANADGACAAYRRAERAFRGVVAEMVLGKICARYGKSIVATGLNQTLQAIREAECALALFDAEWRWLRSNVAVRDVVAFVAEYNLMRLEQHYE